MTHRHTLFQLISAAMLVAALSVLSNCSAAEAVERWPRNPTTPQEQRDRRTPSTVTPRPTPGPTPGGLGCDMRRRYSATSCDPNNRPASPRGGPR